MEKRAKKFILELKEMDPNIVFYVREKYKIYIVSLHNNFNKIIYKASLGIKAYNHFFYLYNKIDVITFSNTDFYSFVL